MLFTLYIICGFAIGIISGFLGIGGGAMFIPLFIYAFKMNMYQAVGTSLAVIGPISIIGALSHHTKGNVDLGPVVFVAIAAAVGIALSGQLIHHIPELVLRRFFAVFLIIVAVKLLMK